MNLRIGILIEEFKDCSNWQLRVIQAILDDPTLEMSLVIQKTGYRIFKKNSSLRRFFSKFGIGRLLLTLQICIEKKVFFKEVFCADKERINIALKKLPIVKVGQRSKRKSDVLGLEIIEQIKQQNLDLIINLEGFHHFFADLTKVPKYGAWDILHADFSLPLRRPAGFSEVLQKKSSIGFTLMKRTADMQVTILDQAFFNRAWSMVETARISQEGGVSVVLKNLKQRWWPSFLGH